LYVVFKSQHYSIWSLPSGPLPFCTSGCDIQQRCSPTQNGRFHHSETFKAAKSLAKPRLLQPNATEESPHRAAVTEPYGNTAAVADKHSLRGTLREFCFLWQKHHWMRNPISYTKRTDCYIFLKSTFWFILPFGKGT